MTSAVSGGEKRPELQRHLSRLHSSCQNTGASHTSAKKLITTAATLMTNSVITGKAGWAIGKIPYQITLMDVAKYPFYTLQNVFHWEYIVEEQLHSCASAGRYFTVGLGDATDGESMD